MVTHFTKSQAEKNFKQNFLIQRFLKRIHFHLWVLIFARINFT